MRLGILRDDVADNWDAEGFPLFEEFLYADQLDLARYYDVTTVSYLSEYSIDAEIDENTKRSAEFLMEEDWFHIWDYDSTQFGDISFHEDRDYVVYQTSDISFDFKEWEYRNPGTVITVRLYCNGDSVSIDGTPIKDINLNYINESTNFVIINNTGIFQAGVINFLTFKYALVEDSLGNVRDEIRVTIDVVEAVPSGVDRGMRDWTPNTYYEIGSDVIGPDNRMYNCIIAHTSTSEIDLNNWERQGGVDQGDADLFIKTLNSDSITFDTVGSVSSNQIQPQTTRYMADWQPNTYYSVTNDVIGPDNRFYNCIEAHTSTDTFDPTKWERQGGFDQQDASYFNTLLNG